MSIREYRLPQQTMTASLAIEFDRTLFALAWILGPEEMGHDDCGG